MVVRLLCLSVGVSSFASSSHSFVRSAFASFVRFVLFLSDDETADRRNLFPLPSGSRFQTEGIVGTEPSNQSTPSSTSSTSFWLCQGLSFARLELRYHSRSSTNYFLTPHRLAVSDRFTVTDSFQTLVARYILDKPKPNLQSCRWNPA